MTTISIIILILFILFLIFYILELFNKTFSLEVSIIAFIMVVIMILYPIIYWIDHDYLTLIQLIKKFWLFYIIVIIIEALLKINLKNITKS